MWNSVHGNSLRKDKTIATQEKNAAFPPFHSLFSIAFYVAFILRFLKRQILDYSRLKEFEDDNFKFDKK